MRRPFPFALQILDTAGGGRRQGSATSALRRGLDCGHPRLVGFNEQGEGENQGSASVTMPQPQKRQRHKNPDTAPHRHTEATTSRPLLLHGIARQTRHGNQTTLTITSNHAQARAIRQALEAVSQLLQRLRQTAEQFTVRQRWRQLLRFIFRDWLSNQPPDPAFLPILLPDNCRI
ncbi:MAG TPA: hypothetical protein EYP40_00645 [Chromatiales bacterium]|nr:hypothetical protein [Chromatiales bacterium]